LARVPRGLTRASLSQGAWVLAAKDRDLARILDHLGEPPLWGRRPGFPALVQIILEQQVSLAAARAMYRRLYCHLGGMPPEGIYGLKVAGLRELGLTRQKAAYCHGLATRVVIRSLDLAAMARLPDDIGRQMLLAVPGLGPWSVDIYYLMALRRPDVWPQGDLALTAALREVKRMDNLPTREDQQALTCGWAPWRSVAARILWAYYLAARGQYSPRPDNTLYSFNPLSTTPQKTNPHTF
jgi:DNA-3-methyladenine glycosylase II